MSLILGDSRNHQQFNWVKRIRRGKNKTQGLCEVVLRHSDTFPCARGPTETNGNYKQGP